MQSAFYDPTVSYEANYEKGPPINFQTLTHPKRKITKTFSFLGFPVNTLFGIPPGPLLNSKFMQAAFSWGFDVSTYKTVRSDFFPCHPFPNVLYVDVPGELHPDQISRLIATPTTNESKENFSITNSFGVPSKKPEEWQKDVRHALGTVGKGQLMILSFMGTVKENQTQQEFIADFATTAGFAQETGAKVIEANLSCPNIGNEGLVCYNTEVTEKVCRAIRNAIGSTPLILKVGYYKNEEDLKKIAEIANSYAQGVAVINTLQTEVVDPSGNQALPGKMRLRSGVCGASIKWAGLEMVTKLQKIRKKNNLSFAIIGIGGVMTPDDYFAYRQAGADLVQSATGAMWNPYLAFDIWKQEMKAV